MTGAQRRYVLKVRQRKLAAYSVFFEGYYGPGWQPRAEQAAGLYPSQIALARGSSSVFGPQLLPRLKLLKENIERKLLGPKAPCCCPRVALPPPSELRNRALVLSAKQHPCRDCGGKFDVACMSFVRPGQAIGADIVKLRYASEARLRAEIEESELVCGNCRRLRRARGGAGHEGPRDSLAVAPAAGPHTQRVEVVAPLLDAQT